MIDQSPPIESDAILWITHEKLEPQTITKLLGVFPTRTHERGNAPFAQWILSSRKNLDSSSPDEHIEWLLNHIEGCREQLKKLRREGYSVEIRCKVYAPTESTVVIIEPALLKRLAEFDLLFLCEIFCKFGS